MRAQKSAVPSNDNTLRAELDMSPMCAGRVVTSDPLYND